MGGKALPTFPGAVRLADSPEKKGLAGVSKGRGQMLSSLATLCPPKCSDTSPSHLCGQQQPQNQYLQVIQRADPPHPSSLPSLGFGRFSRGWVSRDWVRRESPSQTRPSLPPSSQTTGLGPQRFLTSALAQPGPRPQRAGATTIRGEGAALLLYPSFLKGRVQTRWDGGPYWFAPGGGFLG